MSLIGDFIVTIFGGLLPSRWAKSVTSDRNELLRESGQADMAVRLTAGAVDRLGPDFESGQWVVAPGALSLRSISVAVDDVDLAYRLPSFREEFQVFQNSRIYLASGGDATFEIAVQASEADWILAELLGRG